MPNKLDEAMKRIHASAARVLRVRSNALVSEIYGVLEESRVGRGTHYRGLPRPSSRAGDPPARQSGRLQESVRIVSMDEDNLVALVGPDPKAFREEYYAPHLEYGTKAMKPRPFMRVALERFKKQVSGGGS